MRARLIVLWLPFVLIAALSLPGVALAAGYRYTVLADVCAEHGHSADLKIKAIAGADTSADQITLAFKGQERYGGRWHNMWEVAASRDFTADGTRHALTDEHFISSPSHRVRLVAGIRFWQSGLVAWEGTYTGAAC